MAPYLSERAPEETYASLDHAFGEGLIVSANGQARFAHDKIQEAAYSLIPERDRPAFHYRIGRLLLGKLRSDRGHDLFDVVDHLNSAGDLMKDPEERMESARLNLQAAARAEESAAALRRRPGLLDPAARFLLRRRGALATDGRTLTDRGREEARSLVRAHRLWESYLSQNFDLPPDHLHDPAHRIEHYLDAEMQRRLAQELGQPAIDPHGRTIPSLSEPPPRE